MDLILEGVKIALGWLLTAFVTLLVAVIIVGIIWFFFIRDRGGR